MIEILGGGNITLIDIYQYINDYGKYGFRSIQYTKKCNQFALTYAIDVEFNLTKVDRDKFLKELGWVIWNKHNAGVILELGPGRAINQKIEVIWKATDLLQAIEC